MQNDECDSTELVEVRMQNEDDSPKVERDLKKRTKQYALRIIRLYSSLNKDPVAQVLGRQVLRSGTSVGAHYRETSRGRSVAEFVSKMEGGLQELDETAAFIILHSSTSWLKKAANANTSNVKNAPSGFSHLPTL